MGGERGIMSRLFVDTSWRGQHGIGRYSNEIISRLTLDHERFSLGHSPSSLLGILSHRPGRRDDVIYSPGYNAGLATGIQIVTVHDLIHLREPSLKYQAYYKHLVAPAIRRARLVFTVSETSREEIIDWLDDPNVEIVVTGNGRSDAFTPNASSTASGRRYVLYVGNLKPHKNFGVVINTLRTMPDIDLVTVTPDPAATARLATSAGFGSRTRALGSLTEIELRDLYRGAQATLMPSIVEGFGLPALESISSGTPVIYWSGCRSVGEIVGNAGYAASSATDVEEWRALIGATESSPIAAETMVARSKNYDWSLVTSTVESHLLRMAP